jgi:hypothetical protein
VPATATIVTASRYGREDRNQQSDPVIAEGYADRIGVMVQVQLKKLALPVGDGVPAGSQ